MTKSLAEIKTMPPAVDINKSAKNSELILGNELTNLTEKSMVTLKSINVAALAKEVKEVEMNIFLNVISEVVKFLVMKNKAMMQVNSDNMRET